MKKYIVTKDMYHKGKLLKKDSLVVSETGHKYFEEYVKDEFSNEKEPASIMLKQDRDSNVKYSPEGVVLASEESKKNAALAKESANKSSKHSDEAKKILDEAKAFLEEAKSFASEIIEGAKKEAKKIVEEASKEEESKTEKKPAALKKGSAKNKTKAAAVADEDEDNGNDVDWDSESKGDENKTGESDDAF